MEYAESKAIEAWEFEAWIINKLWDEKNDK